MLDLNVNSKSSNMANEIQEAKGLLFGGISYVSMFAGSVFAHEYSHMFAARTLFDASPTLTCDNLFACHVDYNYRIPEGSNIQDLIFRSGIVSAAGPISDMVLTALSSVAAWKMRHTNKKVSLVFAATACTIALNDFLYAINTQGSNFGDFAKVEMFLGIPHSIQTVITGSVALGTALLLGYLYLQEPTKAEKIIN